MKNLMKAEMLPNFIVRVAFDNKEIRYFYLKKKGEVKNIEYWLSGLTNSWIGHELIIEEGGVGLIIDGKVHYTSDELYNKSFEHMLH
ncbi:MAG: hypothetical protein LBI13_09830 [Streptococcaceae bacterium]|jgi:hypothetical protein|nr:hypothetical protein [Streptococcaceae bacterium]